MRPPILILAAVSFLVFAALPTFAQGETGLIDDCRYANKAAAQQAWLPIDAAAPAVPVTLDGQKALRMRCNFAGKTSERAAWDRKVNVDLSQCSAIQFKLFCKNPAPISGFAIYFQSGDDWCTPRHFFRGIESTAGWNTITLNKDKYYLKGGKEISPAVWSQVKTIRLNAWCGKKEDTEFYVTDLRMVAAAGTEASIAIVSSGQDTNRYSTAHWAGLISEDLRALGIGHTIIGDVDVTAARLSKAKIVILPIRLTLPDGAMDELVQFVNAGGKLLMLWELPAKLQAKLQPVVKIEFGQFVRSEYPGYFSTISVADGALLGVPARVDQRVSGLFVLKPVSGSSEVLAKWLDDKGQPTGYAAIVASENCLVCTPPWISDTNTRRVLLHAMIGRLESDVWQQKASDAIARIGQIGGCKTFEEVVAQIGRTSNNDRRVTAAIESARQLRAEAVALGAKKQYPEATVKATAATQRLTEAFCMAQRPLAGESRALWCGPFGVEGMDWDAAIKRLADNGFTAIYPNMLRGFTAFYPSRVLPVAPEVAKRGDLLAQCLAACKKYGVQMHVWKKNLTNENYTPPAEFLEQMRREGRLQKSVEGKEGSSVEGESFVCQWLCPSHPENQKLEIAAMLEVVRNYDVDGIQLDLIRYPTRDYCFCDSCRDRFAKTAGVKIKNWPQDVLSKGTLHKQWLDWRRGSITALVKAFSEQARVVKPKIKISAAVWADWPTVRDSLGQDWKLWCEKGWLDFVCPMDYTKRDWEFVDWITNQKKWAGRTPVYPGVRVSFSDGTMLPVDRVINQIQITRRQDTKGFVIFDYRASSARDLIPMLGLGITARR